MVLVRINLEVPMAYMVLQICDKTRKSDFSTLILCGTVVAPAFLWLILHVCYEAHTPFRSAKGTEFARNKQ